MAHVYRFEDIEVDPRGFRVLKGGKALSIEPKALNVLVFLVENHGRLIEKTELINAVWGDTFVTENVLTRAIGQLRKALGEDSKEARYIETVPTRGYRFIADITEDTNGGAPALAPPELEALASVTSIPPERLERRGRDLRRYAIAAGSVLALGCIGAVVFFVLRWRSNSEYLQVASNTQITTSSGLSFYPTLSPDGTEIAYSTDRGKGFEIFVRQLTPGGKEVQITSDGDQNFQPAWSPDGTLIAYYSRNRGGIWLMPAHGGPPRKVTEFGSHPAWSRDNQWIAFQSDGLDDLGADGTGVGIPSLIWVVRPNGNDARKITNPGQPDGGQGAPSWSPDSKHIAFVSSIHGNSELWSIGADGGGLVRLVGRSAGYYDPIYLPDGKSVVYGAIAYGGATTRGPNIGLWQVSVSPDTSSPLRPPVQITNTGGDRIKNLSLSSDGKKLFYASVGLTGSLHSLPVSKSTDPVGEPVALTSEVGCREILPALSPDGSRIAFDSCHGRAGVRQQIYIMNVDGSNLEQLTFPPETYAFPTWFPDGRRILIEGAGQLVSVDAETRQQKVIAKLDQDFSGPQLAPDGTQATITSSVDGILNIWMVDMASGKQKQFTFDKELAGFGAWSPDGKYIAYEIARSPNDALFIQPSAGGAATQLTPFQGQHWMYGWASDDDKILYARPGNDLIWNIWSVSRSTKVEKQLTHYTKTNTYVRYPSMSPHGNQIVYEYTETTGNIWMLEFK